MAKYTIKFSCGHTAEISLYGKTSERERKIKWYEKGVCPDCYKKGQEEKQALEYQAMLDWAAARNLPELNGSEKQVHFGVKIRDKIIKEIEGRIKADIQRFPETKEQQINGINGIKAIRTGLYKEADASFWIQIRELDHADIIKAWVKMQDNKKMEEEIKPVKEESTLRPEEQKTATVAEVRVLKNRIEIHSDKDQLVIDAVKQLGYRWDPDKKIWYFKLHSMTGTATDRAAEVGNALLCAGVPIIIYDKTIMEKAVKGGFEKQTHLWIYHNKTYGLVATWPYGQDYYDKAKRIPGASWESGIGMKLNAAQYKVIRDFVSCYGFKIAVGAEKVLKAAEEKELLSSKVSPIAVEQKLEGEHKLDDILNSSREIIDDLRDD